MESCRVLLDYVTTRDGYPAEASFPFRPIKGDSVSLPVGDRLVRFRVVAVTLRPLATEPDSTAPAALVSLAEWGVD